MRRYTVGAAIFGALLILGAGLYALNIFEDHSGQIITNENILPENNISMENVNSEVVETKAEITSENKISNSNIAASVSTLLAKDTKSQNIQKQKSLETAKNTTQKTNPQPDSKAPIVFYDPEEGNVKIYDDRIETDEAIIETNRVILKKGGKATVVQPLNPRDIKLLTPEQKAKLFRLRQLQNRYPKPPPPPPPKPSPEN